MLHEQKNNQKSICLFNQRFTFYRHFTIFFYFYIFLPLAGAVFNTQAFVPESFRHSPKRRCFAIDMTSVARLFVLLWVLVHGERDIDSETMELKNAMNQSMDAADEAETMGECCCCPTKTQLDQGYMYAYGSPE